MSDVWTTVSIQLPRDTALLTQFYNTLMLTNFPVAGELEPLDVWINKLTHQSTATQHSLCTLHIDLAIDTSRPKEKQLIGGVVWEYYKNSNCVLITYLVIDPTTRGQGTGLYLCLNAWTAMQDTAQLISNKPMPDIILCEVNDPMKISLNDDSLEPIERIRAFQQMGVRQISDIYYVQPELNNTQPRARDLLLGVVVAPMTLRDEKGKAYVHSDTIQKFITDLYTELNVHDIHNDSDYIQCINSIKNRDKLYFQDFDLSRFKKVKKQTIHKTVTQHHTITNACNVIVIGAGLSGLACARTLQQAGYHVTVVEARHRIGGRVYTGRTWDTRIDFGAAWLHGLDNNPLYEYAQQNIKNLTTIRTDEQSTQMIDLNGQPLSQELVFETYMKFMSFQEQLQELMNTQHTDTVCTQSLYSALQQLYTQQYNTAGFKSVTDKLAFNYLLSFNESLQNASLQQLNARDYALGIEYDGGDHIPSSGFHAIAISLANGLHIQTGIEVNQIQYTYTNDSTLPQVTLKCANDKPDIHCNIVVNTVPIGVLQSNLIQYTPPLPKQRIDSIHRLGAGVYNKVILRFDSVFWATADYIGYLYDAESQSHNDKLNDMTQLHIPHKNVWFVNYYNITNQPILVAMLSADSAVECESLSDDAVVQRIITRLQHMYPNKVTKCVDYQVTRWQSDPYSRCSYSYMKTGASINDIQELQQPIQNTLFWAGEHTSENRFGYTDGAYETGLREAKRIIELYRRYDKTNIDSKL